MIRAALILASLLSFYFGALCGYAVYDVWQKAEFLFAPIFSILGAFNVLLGVLLMQQAAQS